MVRYTALYMASTRTQIYLTAAQRERLDSIAADRGVSMATVVRDAVDAYVGESTEDLEALLQDTFGIAPGLEVPSRAEWRSAASAAPRRRAR